MLMEPRSNGAGTDQNSKTAVVLLVEDEAVVREITAKVLQNGGYCVLESASPDEALQLAQAHRGQIDLLLTDVVMPGMNGVELAMRLRDQRPAIVTIFMSGYAEGEMLRKMTAAGALHIQKPFTIHQLLTRMVEALACAAVPGCTPTPASSITEWRAGGPMPSAATRPRYSDAAD